MTHLEALAAELANDIGHKPYDVARRHLADTLFSLASLAARDTPDIAREALRLALLKAARACETAGEPFCNDRR